MSKIKPKYDNIFKIVLLGDNNDDLPRIYGDCIERRNMSSTLIISTVFWSVKIFIDEMDFIFILNSKMLAGC